MSKEFTEMDKEELLNLIKSSSNVHRILSRAALTFPDEQVRHRNAVVAKIYGEIIESLKKYIGVKFISDGVTEEIKQVEKVIEFNMEELSLILKGNKKI